MHEQLWRGRLGTRNAAEAKAQAFEGVPMVLFGDNTSAL